VSITHYYEIGDIVGLISLVFLIMLAFTFIITNYKIFIIKRKTTISLIILIPIWIILFFFSNIQAGLACMVYQMDIPRYYLTRSSWDLVSLILYFIPTYYFRFRYFSYLKNNDEPKISEKENDV
jgi:hypothetical protein